MEQRELVVVDEKLLISRFLLGTSLSDLNDHCSQKNDLQSR